MTSNSSINNNMENTNELKDQRLVFAKKYIEDNAIKFDFIALFKLLEKIGYYIDSDIEFVLYPSLESAEAYIQKVYFADNLHKVFVYLNDHKMAYFIDEIKNEYEDDYHSIVKFFIALFNEMLRASNEVMFPDALNGEFRATYKNGDALISLNDGNLKSFSYIHSFLEQLFSDFRTVIFEHNHKVDIDLDGVILSESYLNNHCFLGSYQKITKIVICVVIMTENSLSKHEFREVNRRLKIFCKFFKSCLNEINILIKNFVTDIDLYTIFPINLTSEKILLQKIYTVVEEINHK